MKKKILSGFILVCFWATAIHAALAPETKAAGGILFQVPEGWLLEPSASPMRLFQFRIPGDAGEYAEMAVFYFGMNQGGDVESNLQRWKSQFTGPMAEPQREELFVNGIKVTSIYLQGTFLSGMPGTPAEPKSDYAVLGAIIEGPQGNVFFKAMGPSGVIQNARPEFNELMQSVRPAA